MSDSYNYAAAVVGCEDPSDKRQVQLYNIIEITEFALKASSTNVAIVIQSCEVLGSTHGTDGPSLKIGSPTACNKLSFNLSNPNVIEVQKVCVLKV